MTDKICTSQEELAAAIAAQKDGDTARIIIDSPSGVWLTIGGEAKVSGVQGESCIDDVRDSATVRDVSGSATVRYVSGSATVSDVSGSATVRDVTGSATVSYVSGSATVRYVRGSATVRDVRGSATVSDVRDSATVRYVRGSATVRYVTGSATVSDVTGSATVSDVRGSAHIALHGRASATDVGPHVAVHLHSGTATTDGGIVIDVSHVLDDGQTWAEHAGAIVDEDGNAHLFKAVDSDLHAGHHYRLTQYPLGEEVVAPDWRDNTECGYGLHVCPTAFQARDHYREATRFLEVVAPVESLRPIDASKAKVERLTVLREVTVEGRPIEEARS